MFFIYKIISNTLKHNKHKKIENFRFSKITFVKDIKKYLTFIKNICLLLKYYKFKKKRVKY